MGEVFWSFEIEAVFVSNSTQQAEEDSTDGRVTPVFTLPVPATFPSVQTDNTQSFNFAFESNLDSGKEDLADGK